MNWFVTFIAQSILFLILRQLCRFNVKVDSKVLHFYIIPTKHTFNSLTKFINLMRLLYVCLFQLNCELELLGSPPPLWTVHNCKSSNNYMNASEEKYNLDILSSLQAFQNIFIFCSSVTTILHMLQQEICVQLCVLLKS